MPLHAVLLAKEEPDLPAIREYLRKAGIKNPLITFTDGHDLQSFLRVTTWYKSGTVRPCLLLFDLDLPRSNGFELLRWLRQQESWRELKVVIFSPTIDAKDVKRAAALGITRFGPKHPTPRVMADLIADAIGQA